MLGVRSAGQTVNAGHHPSSASAEAGSRPAPASAPGAITRSSRLPPGLFATSGWVRTAGGSASSPNSGRSRTFVDSARINVRAGQGGRGSASFRREPYTPRGGPDGGDGGRGGSVTMKATTGVSDLSLYKRKLRWQAEPGANGAGGRKTGRNGKHLVLDVPVGTVALDPDGAVIADLDHPGAKAVIARGGSGGRGNVHFKSSTHHAPDYAEPGMKGEELAVTLDLEADRRSRARRAASTPASRRCSARSPRRGRRSLAYPFTTLDPPLGVAESRGGASSWRTFRAGSRRFIRPWARPALPQARGANEDPGVRRRRRITRAVEGSRRRAGRSSSFRLTWRAVHSSSPSTSSTWSRRESSSRARVGRRGICLP
jgi:hypothetical protein